MSYRQSDPFNSMRGALVRAGAPFTVSIILVSAVMFLVDTFSRGAVTALLGCYVIGSHIAPIWGPLTYPLITANFINVVFACLWMWFMGSSLERAWGTQRFGFFALGASLVTVLCVWLGCSILHLNYILVGLWVPLSAVTVAWAAVNLRQTIQVYMVLTVPAWVLALFQLGLVYFVYFQGQPVLGLFGLLPSVAAFYYVNSGLSTGYGFRGYAKRGPDLRLVRPKANSLDGSRPGFNPVGWIKDWQERRRLRKLWRNSGYSDRDRRP